MDISKAFETIHQELFIAKFHSCAFSIEALVELLYIKVLNSQSRGLEFKTIQRLQGKLSLKFF